MFGVTSYLLDRLQSILNAAARLILRISKFGSISSAIRDELHWLPVRSRIVFKQCLLVRNCLAGSATSYLAEFCAPVSSIRWTQSLRSASQVILVVPRVRTKRYDRRGFSVSGPHVWNLFTARNSLSRREAWSLQERTQTLFNAATLVALLRIFFTRCALQMFYTTTTTTAFDMW